MEKTKASTQEKVEKMTTGDPMQKEMAREKKEDRKEGAELEKQAAQHHTMGTTGHTTTGTFGGSGY